MNMKNTFLLVPSLLLSLCCLVVLAQKSRAPRTFQADYSHAGGGSFIPVVMTIGESGIHWKFLKTFTREEMIPWNSVGKWGCWGRSYGYHLDFEVKGKPDAGGSFRFGRDKLVEAVGLMEVYAPKKQAQTCDWTKD